jgi:hypothetical protein
VTQIRVPLSQIESAKDSGHYHCAALGAGLRGVFCWSSNGLQLFFELVQTGSNGGQSIV